MTPSSVVRPARRRPASPQVRARSVDPLGWQSRPPEASKPKPIEALFKRSHFDQDIVRLCVCWYRRSGFSLRHLVTIVAERGLPVAHTTIMRWVQRCPPAPEKSADDLDNLAVRRWRVEESHARVRGRACYLYRAVDSTGQTMDFWLNDGRDIALAKAFFDKESTSRGDKTPQ